MLRSNVSRDRGFTLIELLVVLAIVGILLAMAIPSLIAAQNRAKLAQSTDMVVARSAKLSAATRVAFLPWIKSITRSSVMMAVY